MPCGISSWLAVAVLSAALRSSPETAQAAADAGDGPPVAITAVAYQIPDIELIRDDGKRVSLLSEMNDGRAVVVNFIFTACSSFCPLSSQTLAQFQQALGADQERVH